MQKPSECRRADEGSESVQNQVVRVARPFVKCKLGKLDKERKREACGRRFYDIVEPFEAERPEYPNGDEHGDIADEVQLPPVVFFKHSRKRNGLDGAGKPRRVETQRPDTAVHARCGEIDEARYHHKADEHRQKQQLALYFNAPMLQREEAAHGKPCGDNQQR